LEELIAPKLVPLIILKIRIRAEVTMLDFVTHASRVFKTPDIVLKDTHVAERPGAQPVILVEHVDTIREQHVDDLTIGVKHVVLGD
jgi:hypothetical protein